MKINILSSLTLAALLVQIVPLIANSHSIAVNNMTRNKIDVYVRGEGGDSPAKPHATIEGKTKKEFRHNRPEAYMDIVVVSHGAKPDWNPTGATCKHLLTTTSHTVVVDDSALGLKYSCEVIK